MKTEVLENTKVGKLFREIMIITILALLNLKVVSICETVVITIINIITYIVCRYVIRTMLIKETELFPTFEGKYYREIPKIKPAILRYAIYGNSYDIIDFKATILDLINKGYLKIEKKENEYYLIKNKSEEELLNYERNLITLLFERYGNNDEIKCEMIKNNMNNDCFAEYRLEAWKMLVRVEAERHCFCNRDKEKFKRIITVLVIITMVLILMVGLNFLLYETSSIFYQVYIVLNFILSGLLGLSDINKLSFNQEVIDDIEKSKALGRFLKDYSQIDDDEIDSIKVREGYMVYAYALEPSQKIDLLFDKILGDEVYK